MSDVRTQFRDAVNMTPKELEDWLEADESKAVGQKGGGGESVGHEMGRRIVELLRTKKDDLGEDDETSRWRYSLMNWGHDPLKGS